MAIVNGTNGSETLNGSDGVTNGFDVVYGYGGNDAIYGLGGDDALFGGSGADYLNGGSGIDWAYYSDSTAGVAVSLASGTGANGYAEGDRLVSIESIYGSNYDDLFVGNDGANTLRGVLGNDVLKGGGGADVLDGGSGNDSLNGGAGADALAGGAGVDTAVYSESGAGVVVALINNSASGGDAQGDTFVGIENLTGSSHADQLWGDDAANALNGANGNDIVKGFGGADALNGGNGNDTLWGLDGDDALVGGSGVDEMIGGTGSDTYYVDHASDAVTESGGQGVDQVFASLTYTLTAGADIEFFATTNDNYTVAIDLTGNASGNIIRGNNGNNVVNGGDGDDVLTGLAGQDSFLFDTALDPAGNLDIVTDFNVADDTILLEQDIFSSGLGLGNISAGEFVIGAAALDGNDRIIYDDTTGALYYDADSAGGADAVQFAELASGLALTYLDFYVV
jgi:Ca2+-binding RTX toxin-like protein